MAMSFIDDDNFDRVFSEDRYLWNTKKYTKCQNVIGHNVKCPIL